MMSARGRGVSLSLRLMDRLSHRNPETHVSVLEAHARSDERVA